MKPLNKKQRSKALTKVVGLFVVSFIIAIIVGFSTMNISKISSYSANSELEQLKNNLKFQEEVFAPNVGKSSELLSKLPKYEELGENPEVLNSDIGSLISATKGQVPEEETWQTKMYADVLKVLSDLQLSYNKQLENSGKASEQLKDCNAENQRLQNQLTQLKASGGAGGGNSKQLEKELADAQKRLRECVLENRALKQEIQKLEK